ncbi:hypothetical protein JCM10207_003659 [Rhodosporidiobolus poonsookiae]
MATAALSPAPSRRQAPRQRPTRHERNLLRDLKTSDPLAPRADVSAPAQPSLGWLPLADSAARSCPVVFTPDAAYCFVASGSAVKVYSVPTTQLVSTLSLRPFSHSPSSPALGADESAVALKRAVVTAVLLNPSNPRQLVVGSSDAKVRVWDYLEGRLLRTLEMGTAVVHAAANAALPDHLYVALAPAEPKTDDLKAGTSTRPTTDPKAREQLAAVYLVSLRAARADAEGKVARASDPAVPCQPARRVRLATPRAVRSLALSPDGTILASLTPRAVHLARTADITRGFSQTVAAGELEELTTLAFHPTENYFATGNVQGQIKLWYNVLTLSPADSGPSSGAQAPSTSVLHWHAHAVSSLAFTPNGAYLLSGGEEAVLVLWQLHTGHQEYVPRLGAPISTLTVLDNGDSGEQQVAARLRDGSVVFVGSQKLKIVKTIAGLKADVDLRSAAIVRAGTVIPLAFDPSTSALVLPSGHPSTLQFYSLVQDAPVLELEISPSNRVSSAVLDKPVEPTRVERVAFSKPEKDGAHWMATLDSWSSDGYAAVRQLKFWRKRPDGISFVLSTRVDRPHDAPITSMTFSPSHEFPLLLTTSVDGRIKAWTYVPADSSWRCRLSLHHRSASASAPVASAWSHDGSLFAVAHLRSVTLWSVAGRGQLVHSFSATSVGRPKSVEFVDKEGTRVMVTGTSGVLCWDLLTLDETFSSTVDFAAIAAKANSNLVFACEDSSDSDPSILYLLEPCAPSVDAELSKPRSRQLPFAPRQALWLPSPALPDEAPEAVSLAVTNSAGEVALVGAAASVGIHVAPSRLPTAASGAGATARLFDDIFGVADGASTEPRTAQAKLSSLTVDGQSKASSLPELGGLLLDTSAHSLPPVRLLWRDLMALPRPVVSRASSSRVEEAKGGARVASPPEPSGAGSRSFDGFTATPPAVLRGLAARGFGRSL